MAEVDYHRTGDSEVHIISLDEDELNALRALLNESPTLEDYSVLNELAEALG